MIRALVSHNSGTSWYQRITWTVVEVRINVSNYIVYVIEVRVHPLAYHMFTWENPASYFWQKLIMWSQFFTRHCLHNLDFTQALSPNEFTLFAAKLPKLKTVVLPNASQVTNKCQLHKEVSYRYIKISYLFATETRPKSHVQVMCRYYFV